MRLLVAKGVVSGAAVTVAVGLVLCSDALRGGAGTVVHAAPAQAQSAGERPDRSLLDRYCVGCHNERLRTANLVLDATAADLADVPSHAELWEKVIQKLRTGSMPPAGRPRPDPADAAALATSLEQSLDAAAAAAPNPGRPTIHRLNRAEYANAMRDLLALEIDTTALLPADDAGFGFDNNSDVLTVSPALFDRYLSVAHKVSRLAVGDTTLKPSVETYEISRYLMQDDRVSEELPFGSRGGLALRHFFPLDADYTITVHLQRRRPPEPQELDVRVDGTRVRLFTVGGPASPAPTGDDPVEARDGRYEVRVRLPAGSHAVGASFVQRSLAPDGLGPASLPVSNISYRGKRGAEVGIERIDIGGPYGETAPGDTPSRRRIFVCRPKTAGAGDACARTIIATLTRRAYRRPSTPRDLDQLLPFYKAGAGEGFERGIERALERILVDPQFLFRIERQPAGAPDRAYRLSDVELASRLSFFLWSSMPDDALLDAAIRGELHDPAVLELQVRRMLADPRASALVENFAGQWLYLRNLPTISRDVNLFPRFDDDLRHALQRETELFIQSQLQEDRSVSNLLTADYSYLNERLARHYGIPGIYGSHFRRVALRDDRRRGLLGHGSILTVTAYADRTSPVTRGKWLLENILGAPPPAPPPDVPALPERGVEGQATSVRARMEQHRHNPVCASCHAQMDPLGFALENFDATGRWRTVDEGRTPIDASATLPDGTAIRGPAGLRDLLMARRDHFALVVTEKLLTYALGRGIEFYDKPAVRDILRQSAPDDYRWSSLVLAIVRSVPFQMRRSAS